MSAATGRTGSRVGRVLAALTVLLALSGCTYQVDGKAIRAGSGVAARNNDAERKFPNLLKECEVLTSDIIAETVGADPLDIASTFVGAICRWQAANPAGLIDITRFWFEHGDLDNERRVAAHLNYKVENKTIIGVSSIVMHGNDPNGGCGVASDAAGVVGWWVNPQVPGIDACEQAIKLMELTLATNV